MKLTDKEKMQFEVIVSNLMESSQMLLDLAKLTPEKQNKIYLSSMAVIINSVLIPNSDYDLFILAPIVARLLTKTYVPVSHFVALEVLNEETCDDNRSSSIGAEPASIASAGDSTPAENHRNYCEAKRKFPENFCTQSKS